MTLPDFEKYRQYMTEFKMSDEDRDEITMALWNIMSHFIDQAWGMPPVSLQTKKLFRPKKRQTKKDQKKAKHK